MSAYRKNVIFYISQKQELIEQNYGHFLIQRARITLNKLLSTPQQNGCWPMLSMAGAYFFHKHNKNEWIKQWRISETFRITQDICELSRGKGPKAPKIDFRVFAFKSDF